MPENSIITPSDLTFNGEEIRSISEAIFEAAFNDPAIDVFHTVVTGIVTKKQIVILGLLGLVGKSNSTNCAPDNSTSQIPMSEKFWNPAYIEDRINQCWKDLVETFFVWSLKEGVNKADLTSTDFANFVQDRLSIAIKDTVFRNVWFGDKESANFNESPAGNITNGIDVAFFNSIDGLWKQIFTVISGDSAQYVSIDRNAGSTYAAQKFTTTGAGNDVENQVLTGVMQSMIDNADVRMFEGSEDPIFVMTKSCADQYKRERKAFANIDVAYERVETGIDKLVFDGYTIYVFHFWDRMIKAYLNNGTKTILPHRIILTQKSNLQIGVENEGSLTELDPFYDKVKKEYNIDFGFNLDAKLIEDYKLMAAY